MDTTTIAEVWKPVPGYKGLYEVSNLGRVRCCRKFKTGKPRNRVMKPLSDGRGYLRAGLSVKKHLVFFYIHRLVALVFIGKPKQLQVCNHINGIKWDNRAENLEWVTQAENIRHAMDFLGFRPGRHRA